MKTTETMSKTAAIRAARRAVTGIARRSSTEYVYYAPFYPDQPHGPSTECKSDSYWRARGTRSRTIAGIALHLMGYSDEAIYAAGESDGGSVEDIVNETIARVSRERQAAAAKRETIARDLLDGCPADSRADHETIAAAIRRGDSRAGILAMSEVDAWPETYAWLRDRL